MKKILCFLIIILITCCSFAVFAEETTESNDGMQQHMPGDMGGAAAAGGGMPGGTPPEIPSDNLTPPETGEQIADGNREIDDGAIDMMPGGGMGGRMPFGNTEENNSVQQEAETTSTLSELFSDHFTLISTAAALVLGFIFVIFYNRR